MTKNTRTVWFGLLAFLVVAGLFLLIRDWHLIDRTAACGDPEGPRPTIDLRNFETSYTGYSISLEAEMTGKGKLAGKIEPALLQKLSESVQAGQEFRKTLVAGYNACAVERSSFQSAVLRFQSLDGIARRIDTIAQKTPLSQDERKTLTRLAEQYSDIAQKLGDNLK